VKARARHRTPEAYPFCDGLSEGLIYFILVFGVWALGTTERWSVWTLNAACYALGAVWLFKVALRSITRYRPRRWDDADGVHSRESGSAPLEARGRPVWRRIDRGWVAGMAILTFLGLGYCLVSAVNARATYQAHELRFDYYDYLPWLPHSYDRPQTWFAFWQYLGWAFFFWATRDWLLGKSRAERHESFSQIPRLPSPEASIESHPETGLPATDLPLRLKRLLWVLAIHGTLLTLVGLAQRWSGSHRLLWMVEPVFNRTGEAHFGPYAYRSNAAEYINLVWPVVTGFCWVLTRRAREIRKQGYRAGRRHLWLIPMVVIMAASPVAATTRGGAIIAAVNALALGIVLLLAAARARWRHQVGLALLLLIPLEVALFLGWPELRPRFEKAFSDGLGGRALIYENARQMAEDFPLFGSGPGTFAWLYYFYRADRTETWQGYVHDDWLETRITFGWIGFGMVLLLLVPVAAHGFAGCGIPVGGVFLAALWIALGGCLFHAAFDFPFQIHSVTTLFILLCCLAFCVVWRRSKP
jgi:hypothetical protein